MKRLKTQDTYWLLIALMVLSLLLYGGYWEFVENTFSESSDRGQFGDMFGGVNALFTAFAFAGLIFTAVLQRRELALQRKELTDTRDVLTDQSRELREQSNAMRRQAFDSTFFSLLRMHQEIVAALEMTPHSVVGPTRGRGAFDTLFREIKLEFVRRVGAPPGRTVSEVDLADVYILVYSRHQRTFGHYFRQLYHILKFIEDSRIDDKRRYGAFLRAQLSSDELVCCFYNGLSLLGKEKFKPLAEKYALFKNLPDTLYLAPEHRNLYRSSAFVNPPSAVAVLSFDEP